jgi:CheY-like chemotaxis protein
MTKILLVEDDKNLREIYGVRLIAEGYDIVSAGDGEEALAMAIKERPGLIISDVMMPKISGFDMLDILRSTTETKNIKVIMMTALSSEDQRARGESLGADRYLVKSQVGIEDVIRSVHEVLGDSVAATPQAAPKPTPAPVTSAPAPEPIAPVVAPASPVVAEPAPSLVAPLPAAAVLEPTPSAASVESMPVQPQAAPAPLFTAPVAPEVVEPSPVNPTVDNSVLEIPQPAEPEVPTMPPVPAPAAQTAVGNKVIQPLEPNQPAVNIADLMSQELKMAEPASPLTPPVTPAPTDINNPPVIPPAAPLF